MNTALFAQKGKEDDDTEEKDEFAEIIKDATHRPGFFHSYEKDGHLYLIVPEDRLGADFLMTTTIARGIGSSLLTGGLMLNTFFLGSQLVAFEKHGGKVYLVQRPHRYIADEGSPAASAVDLTFGSSVLQSAKVEASPGDTALVIDTYEWFVSDFSNVGSMVGSAVSTTPGKPGRASFDKDRSFLESVESFDDNINVTAKLTFNPGEPVSVRGVPDSRYVPVSLQYGLVRLPETLMVPREADDRVGYFAIARKDYSQDDRTFLKRYVRKWRLECAGEPGSDGLCDPVKPIRYYIDRTVPEAYRQAMIDGVEAFTPAFEAAGFRAAIHAELLPDSANAADIRYSTLRWGTADLPAYGAIGPSVQDPRTGETLDADILFEASMILSFKNSWRRLAEPAAMMEAMLDASPTELAGLSLGGESTLLASEFAAQGGLLRATLMERGELEIGDDVPDQFVYEAVKWVTMHEVGHTLGLRHNFRSSTDTPLDMLHDRDWARRNGVSSSVMEYPSLNVASDGEPNGHYYNPGMGSYDLWAISYGYTPDPEKAAELARLAAAPGHAYGTDEDAIGSGAIDPTVNVFDLGADPLGWGKDRAALAKRLWAQVPEIALADDEPYLEATDVIRSLLNTYSGALVTGVKYIGGQYQYRDHVGDPDARMPFEPVPVKKQVEALDFIIEYGFAEGAFYVDPLVLQQLGAYRWSDWGSELTVNERIDYPLHETVLNIQSMLLNRVTHPFVFARILDAEHKYGQAAVLGIPELMSRLSEAIWAEAWSSPGRNVPANRRSLQRAHLDRLTEIVTSAPDRTPADARAVARMSLEDLADRLKRRLSPPASFDDYTLAHYRESLARIEKTLEAGLELEN
ncbi:zinc-dependent metalloprotease [Bacteroidota bacterium]